LKPDEEDRVKYPQGRLDKAYKGRRAGIEREGGNFLIQSVNADMTKRAMVLIRDYIKKNNIRSKFMNQVYDEIVTRTHKDDSPDLSTRLKYLITSVDGNRETKTIREFVDKHLLARDAKSLRTHIKNFQPDVDLTFFPSGDSNRISIPIGIKFFWPDFE
jgi:hypothetical protein